MSAFEEARDQLRAAREEERVHRMDRTAARVGLREATVGGRPEAIETARETLAGAREAYASASAAAFDRLQRFAELADPREQLERLGDDRPFLLFPLRIETRFKNRELWVRVFPDRCLIDSFEPVPSAGELRSLRAYWQQMWRAAGDEERQRAAWRGLVASSGSGRGGWLADSFPPANADEAPVPGPPGEVVLVVTSAAPFDDDERDALATYWEARWRAGDDAAARAAALAGLEAAVGADPQALAGRTEPFNLADPPPPGASVATAPCRVVFLVIEDVAGAKDLAWTNAPRVDLLPERLVLIAESAAGGIEELGEPIPSPLFVGPDPSATEDDQLQQLDGDLNLPPELLWMADFDEAVRIGMGFRVRLTAEQARAGFDRLYVLGSRLASDPEQSREELEALLADHHRSRTGLSLLAQGTATNNTEATGSGFTRGEDADASFDVRARGPLSPVADPAERPDGQHLADALGIGLAAVSAFEHADGRDQADRYAMQALLWPATAGYLLTTMLEGVVDDDAVEDARTFFTRHVSGRGTVPALRIGDQPYGILATTAFSRVTWADRRAELGRGWASRGFLADLWRMSEVVEKDWEALAAEVPAVGWQGADAHETLLGILGLHPSSVEFHYRYAESIEALFNRLNLAGLGGGFWEALIGAALDAPALGLLARLGYEHDGERRIKLLEQFFHGSQGALQGPVIDDRPLSEDAPIRPYAGDANYLEWLAKAAATSLDAVRAQEGFDAGPPQALLYLLARHALMLGFADASWDFHRSAGVGGDDLARLRREAPFIHVEPHAAASESRFMPLYASASVIHQSPGLSVAEHIVEALSAAPETRRLREQLAALERLARASTARLERALAEHIDTVSYRFDAWRLGFVALQLEHMRREDGAPRGIHLGAYGWLEHVRPESRKLTPVELDDELAKVFARPEDPPLARDSSNGGFVHAPSLNHAVTASVLRSGYLANASQAEPEAMAVNLSSQRVRLALGVLEGMRNGQSLAALLGYRLERGLHDRHALAEVDEFIYELRRAFPLGARKLRKTAASAGMATATADQVAARNVVDGLALVDRVQKTGDASYPFGLPLKSATAAQRAVIDEEVDRLRDLRDAVADLALAEGVHQAAQGNFDRVSATLGAYASGHHPPEPDVVRTPSAGLGLTHRVGLHLAPGRSGGPTPRSVADPAVDHWLAGLLPALGDIACEARWKDPVTAAAQTHTVTLAQLGLRPIDVIEVVRGADEQAMAELDDRVVSRVIADRGPRPDARVEIAYMHAPAGKVSVFAAARLVAHARGLLSAARPLRASDLVPPERADGRLDATAAVDRARVADVLDTAADLLADVEAYLAAVPDPAPVAAVDGLLADAVALLDRGARLSVPGSGWGFALSWRQEFFAAAHEQLRTAVAAWTARLDAVDARIAAYDALPAATPDPERLRALAEIESAMSSVLDPPPPTPAAGRAAVEARRDAFAALRDAVAAIGAGSTGTVAGLLAEIEAVGPLAPFDTADLGAAERGEAAVAFVADLEGAVAALRARLAPRVQTATDALAEHDAAADAPARLEALRTAGQALLGEQVLLVPEFTITAEHGGEWQAALDEHASGELLRHLHDDLDVDLPVDEWLHGIARVRAPLRHLEQSAILAEGFGRAAPALDPIQLPHRAGERWLALQFPPDQATDGERLLYTAAYTTPFAAAAPQCGLLLDEWTEVIPGETASTGVAFHFDRPNSEPPQAMLLVTPATWDGAWQWEDLLQALPDTLRLARQRAVEPTQVDATAYARFLPATISAVTLYGLTISLALAANNGALEAVADA
jgi:hypothetical protein